MPGDMGIRPPPTIFDDPGFDVTVFDHHRVVEHGHVGHAAVAVAGIEITSKYRILFGGRHRYAHLAHQVAIEVEDAAHAPRCPKGVAHDPQRDEGAAGLARGPISDRLAAPETAMRQKVVEL